MEYDYMEAVKADVLEYIRSNVNLSEFNGVDELEEYLDELLYIEDSVTGNASGSYTFSRWQAEEYLTHNLSLAVDALEEFGYRSLPLEKLDAEYLDVTIRCYCLPYAISQVLEENFSDADFAPEKD